MEKYGGVEVQLHPVITSALNGGECPTARFTLAKETQYSLNTRLRAPQNRSGRFRADKNVWLQSGLEPQIDMYSSGRKIYQINLMSYVFCVKNKTTSDKAVQFV
jgi:hypothetical protein